ncbi:hypothetical protein DM558_12320 [Entomomonas moraniae]|uniref:Uncharacterized protein n=1 Tax=Entomomonas moraniae TaxID=2213226 RepID=A0A3Q9JMB1_9GAMM|nr:hypothetical protein [Entomomonas moraniae]AZS51505.1 hypothetical protein DM558_12320 [Entomomonas moraniae]
MENNSDKLLGELDRIAKNGYVIVIKLDGERDKSFFYTAILSRSSDNEFFFRKDGPELEVLIKELIDFYNKKVKV